jgi:hypothetical protein
MQENTKKTPISYRPPEDLREWLEQLAKQENRSVNRQLTHLLEHVRRVQEATAQVSTHTVR